MPEWDFLGLYLLQSKHDLILLKIETQPQHVHANEVKQFWVYEKDFSNFVNNENHMGG